MLVTKVTISPKFHSFECINVDLFTSIRAMLMFLSGFLAMLNFSLHLYNCYILRYIDILIYSKVQISFRNRPIVFN